MYFLYISKFEVPANNENNDYLKNVECNFVIEDLWIYIKISL